MKCEKKNEFSLKKYISRCIEGENHHFDHHLDRHDDDSIANICVLEICFVLFIVM